MVAGRLLAKNLNMAEKSTQIHLNKFLPLIYYHSHFLAATLDSHLVNNSILGGHTLFTAGLDVIEHQVHPEYWYVYHITRAKHSCV